MVVTSSSGSMLGKAYNKLGKIYRQGLNGFSKDIKKSYDYFQKAVESGNAEALYSMGLFLFSGEIDGLVINRDYRKANEYIYRAAQNGNERAKEILQKYGIDGVILVPIKAEAVTYRIMGGYELTASSETIKWLQLYYGIRYKAFVIANTFRDDYVKRFTTFKQMIDGVHQLYTGYVAQMLQWGVKVLMSFGIDSYDSGDILGRCDDLALLPRVPRFEHGLEAIDNRASQLNLKTAYAQATRGYWVGGGFGTTIGGTIAGSIKGSVAAGAMNVGSGILHGIGDSIVGAMNNSEIKGMENRLFENLNTKSEFQNAVFTACNDVGDVIRTIIEESSDIGIYELSGKVIYNGENLTGLAANVINAKINNNLSVRNLEYSYALIVEKLRREPLNNDLLKLLYQLTLKRKTSLEDGVEDFEVLERYEGDFGLKILG